MTWQSKADLRAQVTDLSRQLEGARAAFRELQTQLEEQGRGLGFMRQLWPALQPVITFENPLSEHWELDVKSLELMFAVVKFGPEIAQQLKDGDEQMRVLKPTELNA